ncbi:GNAT family N-acetyltransferase [Microlunatus speluncae]|uniref:GNAT family N-acetyltransferase n=1 Tax=Microlunatus speluncae TaxID=2594267 RepID=UPI00126645B8|nr:GNAT family protein [Microlunatus speluncae]
MTSLSYPDLGDPEIALRAWRTEDAEVQLAGLNDPLFLRYSDAAAVSRDQVVRRIAAVDRLREAGTAVYLAIVAAADRDEVLGEASLSGIDPTQRRASVGYWLVPAARGRGAATRAVRLLAGWAFGELALARLELTCGPDNLGSQQVARRAGFQQEGLLRSHLAFKGGRRDSLIFGLLPSDLAGPATS